MLLGRLDYEKQKLVEKFATTKFASFLEHGSTCCVFTPDVLCRRSGLECWLTTQPIVNETSLSLDLGLLHYLTEVSGADIEEQHHVRVCFPFSIMDHLRSK